HAVLAASMTLCSTSLIFYRYSPTPPIYTLSLHDALPIFRVHPTAHAGGTAHRLHAVFSGAECAGLSVAGGWLDPVPGASHRHRRSEEHTSELQSRENLVCRLLLEKKKTTTIKTTVPGVRR